MHERQQLLNEFVEKGTGPVFGYPPMCYSPPNEFKQDFVGNEAISVLMKHIFLKNENLPSVQTLIQAKQQTDNIFSDM